MARIRTIKPQFFMNEEIAELSAMNRLLFVALWTQADREGRLIDRPKRLKAEIFPYDNFDMEKGLQQLSEANFIIRYKVNVNATGSVLTPEQPKNELAIIQIVNFLKHQKIDKINEKDSELPPPATKDYLKTSGSLVKVGEGKGREGNERTISELTLEDCTLPPEDIGYKVIDSSIKLFQGFMKHFPKNKDLPKTLVGEWVPPVRELMQKKEYTYDQIADVLNWTMSDPFWKKIIIDTVSLEKNFEKLKIQYQHA
jgi:hypothetical protein